MERKDKSQKERMIAGEFYNPVDRELLLARVRARYIADKAPAHGTSPTATGSSKNFSRTEERARFLSRISA